MSKGFYIVATYTRTLRNPGGTDRSDSAWQDNEKVECCKNVAGGRLAGASVVLDVTNQRVVKNRFDNGRGFEELYAYYLERYADYINEWLEIQLSKK